MSDASELGTAVAAIFGAVVGVLGSILAFSPRVRALERDATAAEVLRKEQREGDTRMFDLELRRIREEAARQHSELTRTIDGHHERTRRDCAQTERREVAMLQLIAQVAAKLKVDNRLSDSLTHLMTREPVNSEEDHNG